jgi:Carboxypeptidase regulatory-like domain
VNYTSILLALLLAGAGVAVSEENHGAVSGIVIEARSQTPLSGARVVMPGVGEATTDEAGRFKIANVSPGKHSIHAVRTGMATLAEDRSSETVVIGPGEDLRNLRLRLAPFGIISGEIRDDQGAPLSGASVRALAMSYQQGRQVFAAPSLAARILNSSTETDEKGAYRLDLPPGAYYICAQYRTSTVNEDGAARVLIDRQKVCYPGTADMALAETVTVNGQENSGIDFRMARLNELHRIYVRLEGRGQIALNTALAGVQIAELRDRESLERFPVLGSVRQGLGSAGQSLVIDGVPNGSYDLLVDGLMEGGRRGRAITHVDIRGADLHDVVVTLQPARDIAGRVVIGDPAGSHTSGLTVRVGSRSANVATDGTFVIPNVLSGFYSVGVDGLPPDAFIADIRYDGTSVLEAAHDLNGPEIQTGSASSPLEIVLSYNGGAVDGVIDAGVKAAGASVVLVPATHRRFVQSYYKAVIAGPAGAFSLKGVPPGQYQLFAWRNVPDTAWMNPEFMSRWEGRGLLITILPGDTVSVRTHVQSVEE